MPTIIRMVKRTESRVAHTATSMDSLPAPDRGRKVSERNFQKLGHGVNVKGKWSK